MCGTVTDISRFIATALNLISIFFWIYLVRVLNQNKHKLLFVKRGVILLQAYVYVSFFQVAIFAPINMALSTDCVPDSVKAVTRYIAMACTRLTLESIQTIFTLRILSHYANIQRSESIDDENINVIVKYHKIFGNYHKLFIIYLFTTGSQAIMFIIVIIMFGYPYNYDNLSLVSAWFARIMMPFWIARLFITFYCFIKSKHFKDHWLITKELKYSIISLLIITSIFFVIFIATSIIFAVKNSPMEKFSIYVLVYTILFLFSVWVLISNYICVIWVNKMDDKLSQNINGQAQENTIPGPMDMIAMSAESCSSNSGVSVNDNVNNINTRSVNMFDVLTNKQCMYLTVCCLIYTSVLFLLTF